MQQIILTPESAHHFQFFPMAGPVGFDMEKAKTLVSSDTLLLSSEDPSYKALLKQCNASEDWRSIEGTPWIRYRFGTKDYWFKSENRYVRYLGIWWAIDTAIGNRQRGYIYDQDDNPNQDHAGWVSRTADDCRKTPYASLDQTRLPENAIRVPDCHLPDELRSKDGKPAHPALEFLPIWREKGGEAINVDIIVDFGSTRTVVLALEETDQAVGKLSSICRPIKFIAPDQIYEDKNMREEDDMGEIIPESWFVLRETPFASFVPPEFSVEEYVFSFETVRTFFRKRKKETLKAVIKRVPQIFVSLSPAAIGPSARVILATMDTEEGGCAFMSSPKRYAWDTDPTGVRGGAFWTMELNEWNNKNKQVGQLSMLRGEVLRYMPMDGSDWPLECPPTNWPREKKPSPNPDEPNYPRADALTWTALQVLETAHRQIQSEEWRKGNNPSITRRLRGVLLSYPSGWTEAEVKAYRAKWQKALNIFSCSRFGDPRSITDGGDGPDLRMELDEAVSSQLAIIFSEIHRMRNFGENWLSLLRPPKSDKNSKKPKARVMCIDIGGGTTDTSIIEYSDELKGRSVDLKATLLFKDSSSISGDMLVRNVIERVLLPKIGEESTKNEQAKSVFESLFLKQARDLTEKAEWSLLTRLVLLPMVYRWLADLCTGQFVNPATSKPWTPAEMGASVELIGKLNGMVAEKGGIEELLPPNDPLTISHETIEEVARDTFERLFAAHAKFVSAFDCDMVIVTGKPSELAKLRSLLEFHLPIQPNRIIFAKGYPAGDWLPMSRDGTVSDAKLVTAIGGAVYQAARAGLIKGWRIECKNSPHMLIRNYWGEMPAGGNPRTFATTYLKPDEGVNEAVTRRIMTGTFIGRSILERGVQPEQIYIFQWKDQGRRRGPDAAGAAVLSVALRRGKGDPSATSEALELVKVDGEHNGEQITMDDVELKLCTLKDADDHWLDSGRFEVRWPV